MARLIADNGAVVHVDDSKVERLLKRGFVREEPKAPAPKRAASKKSEK